MRATRFEVYTAIDGERQYQERVWPGHRHTVTEYTLYMQHYLTEAIRALSTQDGEAGGLNILRKVTALGVACMEENGAPPRMVPNNSPSLHNGRQLLLGRWPPASGG